MGLKDLPRRAASAGRPRYSWAASSAAATGLQAAATGGEPIDTSHVMTAAEAKEALGMSQARGQKLVDQGPGMMSRSEWETANEIADSGWAKALGGLGTILSFIDRPFQMVGLAIRDVTNQDVRAGKEIEGGAYWDMLMGRNKKLVEEYGEEVVGREGRISGSLLLDELWKHDDDDSWWDKALRGVASFGVEAGLDPLTYLTFGASGVGKTVAAKSANATILKAGDTALQAAGKLARGEADDLARLGLTRFERDMAGKIVTRGDDLYGKWVKELTEEGVDFAEDELRSKAYKTVAGGLDYDEIKVIEKSIVPEIGQEVGEEATRVIDPLEIRKALGHRGGVVGDEQVKIVADITNRNFGSLRKNSSAYVEHVFERRGGKRLGSPITVGGARLGLPFGTKMQSRPLALTQGAFENWVGLKQLHKVPASKLGQRVRKLTPLVDAEAPWLMAAERGLNLKAGEARFDELDWALKSAQVVAQAARNDHNLRNAFKHAEALHTMLRNERPDTADEVWASLFPALLRRDTADSVLDGASDELRRQYARTVEGFMDITDESLRTIQKYSPNTGAIEGYMPLVFSKEFQVMMRRISQEGAPIDGHILEQEAQRLSQLAGEEVTVDDVALFMEVYENTIGQFAGRAAVGEAAPFHRRTTGRFLRSLDPEVDTRISMFDAANPEKAFQGQPEMNTSIGKVLKALAADDNVDISAKQLDKMGEVFVTDPIELMQNYVAEVAAVAEQRVFMNNLLRIGAARKKAGDINADHVMFLLGDTLPGVQRRVREVFDNNRATVEQIMDDELVTETVDVGLGSSVQIPRLIRDHPQVEKAVAKLRRLNGKMENLQIQYQEKVARQVKNLMDQGHTRSDAVMIATMNSKELADMRQTYMSAIEAGYDEAYGDISRIYFEIQQQGFTADEIIQSARARRDVLMQTAQDEYDAIEAAYIERVTAKLGPEEVEVPKRLLDPNNQVEYSNTMNAIMAPLTEQYVKIRDSKIEELTEESMQILERRNAKIDELNAKAPLDRAVREDPTQGHETKVLEVEIKRLNEIYNGLVDVIDALHSAKSVDDEIATVLHSAATTVAAQDNAKAFHMMLNDIMEMGVPALRTKHPKMADAAQEIWERFSAAVAAREGSISTAEFDQPWFWAAVIDGIRYDWDYIEEGKRAGWWPSDGPNGSLFGPDQIIEEVEQRLARAQASQAADFADVDINLRMSAIGGAADPQAVKDSIAAKIAALQGDLQLLRDGDDHTWDMYIVSHVAGLMEKYQDQAMLMQRQITRGVEVGDSVAALERHFQTLMSAAYDPVAKEQLVEAVDFVNPKLRTLPNKIQLAVQADGSVLVKTVQRRQRKVMPLNELLEAYKRGDVDELALEEQGLGFIVGALHLDDAVEMAKAKAIATADKSRYAMKKADAALKEWEVLKGIIDDVVAGKSTAERLRRWAFEGMPSGRGGVKRSQAWNRLVAPLPLEEQDRLERLVRNTMISDRRLTSQGRELRDMQNEAHWDKILFRPLEETYQNLDRTIANLQQQARRAASKEEQEYAEMAQVLIRELAFIDEWRREGLPEGTRLISQSARTGFEGKMRLEQALANAVEYAKRLEAKGPVDLDDMTRKGGKILAEQRGLTGKEVERFEAAVEAAIKGSKATVSSKGMVDPAAYGLGGALDDLQMDAIAAQIFRNLVDGQKYLYTPEGVSEFRNTLNSLLNWWRPAATIARPNFHLRNLMSGVANGLLIGVNAKEYTSIIPDYVRFRRALMGREMGSGVEDVFSVVSKKNRPIFQAAYENNVMSTGFARGDIVNRIQHGRPNLNPLDRDKFVLFRAGGATMENMEDVLRLAAFSKYYDPANPYSAEVARQMVMAVHFDYQNLTHLEKNIKKVAPFFVWTRRNVPLQVRAIVEKPGYAQLFHHASRAMQENFGTEEYWDSPTPSWYGYLAAPLGVNLDDSNDTWARFVFNPDLPLGNLEDLPLFDREQQAALPFSTKALSPMAWVNYTAELLGPQFSVPIDWIAQEGTSDYKVNAPAGLNEIGLLLENLDYWQEQFTGVDIIDAEGADWRIGGLQNDLFNTALPFFKDLTGAVENSPTRAARLGLDNENDWKDRVMAELLGLSGAGEGFYTQTPSDAKSASYEAQEIANQIGRQIRESKADNPLSVWD